MNLGWRKKESEGGLLQLERRLVRGMKTYPLRPQRVL